MPYLHQWYHHPAVTQERKHRVIFFLPVSLSFHSLSNWSINLLPTPSSLSPKYLKNSFRTRLLPSHCVQDLLISHLERKYHCLISLLEPNPYLSSLSPALYTLKCKWDPGNFMVKSSKAFSYSSIWQTRPFHNWLHYLICPMLLHSLLTEHTKLHFHPWTFSWISLCTCTSCTECLWPFPHQTYSYHNSRITQGIPILLIKTSAGMGMLLVIVNTCIAHTMWDTGWSTFTLTYVNLPQPHEVGSSPGLEIRKLRHRKVK